jgi:hypothetical protein
MIQVLAKLQQSQLISAEVFAKTSRIAELVPSNEAMSQYNGDLITLKEKL